MRFDPALARKLLQFVMPYRAAALRSSMFVSLTVILNLIPPLLYKRLIDDAIRTHDAARLAALSALILAAILISAVFHLLEEYFSCQFGLTLMNDVRNRLYKHLQALSLGFFHRTSNGAIIARFTSDLLNVQKIVARTLPSILTNVLMLVFSIAIMLYLSWELTIITLVTLPLYAAFSVRIARILAALSERAMQHGDRMITAISEDFSMDGLLFFKLFGAEGRRRGAFKALTAEIQQIRLQLAMWGRSNSVVIEAIQLTGVVAIYYVGGGLVAQGTLTLGTIIAFAAMASRLYQPIAFFSSSAIDLPTGVLSLDRINAFFAEPPQQLRVAPAALHAPVASPADQSSVVFHNVCFTYPEAAGGVQGLSFKITRGERVSLAGANGSGKTTLFMLMAGILRPDSGAIYLAGRDIAELSQAEISDRLSVALGQGFFLNASIRDNLHIVRPDASDEQIAAAVERAECADFLSNLPEGLSTTLGQSGMTLSAGQRQRLAVARLYLKDAEILCLDETTANIDAESESAIIETLQRSDSSKTTIVISHTLKTVRQAPRILMLEQGTLVGDGSHDELADTCGAYRRLFLDEPALPQRCEETA